MALRGKTKQSINLWAFMQTILHLFKIKVRRYALLTQSITQLLHTGGFPNIFQTLVFEL